jgi:hypothetical protein
MRARPGWVNEHGSSRLLFLILLLLLILILILLLLFPASAVAHKIRSTIRSMSMSMKKRWANGTPFRLDTKPDLFHSQAVRETDFAL